MPGPLGTEQRRGVFALAAGPRFTHFVGKIVDTREVWSLCRPEGWVTMETEQDELALPFWPHSSYARAMATDAWRGAEPARVELAVFLERWLPGMARGRRRVAVFPTLASRGVVVDPADLARTLAALLAGDEGCRCADGR